MVVRYVWFGHNIKPFGVGVSSASKVISKVLFEISFVVGSDESGFVLGVFDIKYGVVQSFSNVSKRFKLNVFLEIFDSADMICGQVGSAIA